MYMVKNASKKLGLMKGMKSFLAEQKGGGSAVHFSDCPPNGLFPESIVCTKTSYKCLSIY